MPKYKRSPTIHTTPFLHRTTRAPSARRLKLFTILFAISLVFFLFYRSTSSAHDDAVGDFYYKTKTALDHDKEDHTKHSSSSLKEHDHEGHEGHSEGDEEITKKISQSLKDAAREAKEKANAKAPKPDPPSSVIGVGSAAEGTEKGGVGRKKGVAGQGNGEQKVVKEDETEEDHEVEVELNSILKKAPIIIFSKSYCPHSARAKSILLEKYILDPPPFVVELDKHPLGLNLQARLAELTNRRTVPNVLVNGVSIGGGDDVAALDEGKKLVDKIREFAGKKMVEIRLKAGSNAEREKEKTKKGAVSGSDGAV